MNFKEEKSVAISNHSKKVSALITGIAALILGILFCAIVLWSAELALRWFDVAGNTYKRHYSEGYFVINEQGVTGTSPGRHRVYTVNLKTKKVIYDVTYSFDAYGRRVTPVPNEKERQQFLLFLGCSFTLGEGVGEDETLPYYTAQLASDYYPYNYGFHGNGPFDILAKLETEDLSKQVKEKKGVILYTFIDNHIRRVVGSTNIIEWNKKRVYYQTTKSGELIRAGNFQSARPFLMGLYQTLSKSRILKALNIEIPLRIRNKDIQLAARVIEAMQNRVAEKFPDSPFYVVFYPGSKYSKQLISYLEKKNIQYLDYSKLFNRRERQYYLAEEDKHPSALANQTLAKAIANDLL